MTGPNTDYLPARTDTRLGAVETGGTKIVCLVGTAPGHIVAQTRIPTRKPAERTRRA